MEDSYRGYVYMSVCVSSVGLLLHVYVDYVNKFVGALSSCDCQKAMIPDDAALRLLPQGQAPMPLPPP